MSTITSKLRHIATLALVAGASATVATSTVTSEPSATVPTSTVAAHKQPGWVAMLPKSLRKACATEDSVNCYWDARAMGNGRGHSYVVRAVPRSGGLVCVFYVAKKDAARWDNCSR